MKNKFLSHFAVVSIVTLAQSAVAQDHGHLYVGATTQNQNEPLIFDNGGDFATSAGYVKTLDYTTSGTYAGYYLGNITLTVRAATAAHPPGPEANAPALGSWIFVQLVSVDGPPGGGFAFWDTSATNPTYSLASGQTGTNTWRLSQNDGSPGTDPFGHIHGRRFTATKPGIYTVTFRAFDYSTNGVGGGSIHTPSDLIKIYFQAGVNIKAIQTETNVNRVTFGARAGFVWQLEASESLAPSATWNEVGNSVLGDDYFHEVEDDQVQDWRFYRVKGTPYVP